jgi:hypothetical protein
MRHVLLALLLGFANVAVAAEAAKTLIVKEGDKFKPGLAKSWKKVSDGKIKFELDTAAKVKDKPLTAEMVKDSLEKRFAKKNNFAAEKVSASSVQVSFDAAAEADVLDKISKTSIKSQSIELANDTSTTDGGVRAKTAERSPEDGEVKGSVVKAAKGLLTVRVIESKAADVKAGKKVVVPMPKGATYDKDAVVFFKPTGKGKAGDLTIAPESLKTE